MEFDSSFEKISQDVSQLLEEAEIRTKARIYVEFQYMESNQFFSLFKRFKFVPGHLPTHLRQYCCIQYQDYSIIDKKRAIDFPKYLLLEQQSGLFN